MPYMVNKRTGERVQVDANGMPVSGGAQPPRDPTFQYKGPQAAVNVQKTQADIENDAKRIELERQRVALAQQAQANAAAAQRRADEVASRERGMKLGNLRALENQLGRVRSLYKTGPGATKGLLGLQDYLPTPENKQFDSAGAGLAELGLSAFRVPGVGSQSDAELRAFVEANRPSSKDYDKQIEEKLGNLENRLGEAYRAYGVQYPRQKPAASRQGGKRPSRVIDFNDWGN